MDPEAVDAELRRHLERNGLLRTDQVTSWKVGLSKLSGRGLIATRDIAQDELIYTDAAVVMGPRCHPRYLPLCVGCHSSGLPLFPCELDCGLPVCSNDCQNSVKHQSECSYLRALEPTCGSDFSIEILQALVPIRAVLMPDHQKRLVHCVQCNEAAQHGREVIHHTLFFWFNVSRSPI
ncbi:hypothetical protein QAD02_016943 [Eretmocerus hayati]|uniref:Uncharacterized protein n=1 Tax=Eretmocerus hayati TaxID=131215 RepID=A0ACC2PCH7_9HYME|nr:hypothetical protein QAD02_016943 [Eretmocerus hayati]